MIKLFTLITQMCCVIAAVLVWLANEWLTVGYGLNPWISITAATVFMIIPHAIDHWFVEDIPDDDPHGLSTIELKRPDAHWFKEHDPKLSDVMKHTEFFEVCENQPVRDY